MAIDFRQISIDRFQEITNFNLSLYLIKCDSFFTNNYPKIQDWYSGNSSKPDVRSFKALNRLVYESDVINGLVLQHKDRFDKTYFWDLLENLEDLKINLTTTTNLSKFLRSTITKNSFTSALEIDYTTKKYDTLENIQYNKISPVNFDDDWINIALRNDLSEEDYDIEGGKDIKIPTTFNSIFLNSVIDNLIGERVYGLDLNKKLTFVNDDLEVMDYQATFKQAIEILIGIKKGSVPEFPQLGINDDLVVGTNMSSFSLPVLQRQLSNLFDTDDSIVDFTIEKIEQVEDALFITFTVNSILGSIQQNTIQIQK